MENKNTRRCGQIGEGEDDELSMVDVLEETARLNSEASAVLGGSDAKNCTYPKGYVKRQALYACATCTPGGNAGICLACSYACHEGHDLYELYTKRNFTCDCGNDKFAGKATCKLVKGKKSMNSRNRYSQNFKGTYCTCARPYPDAEDSIEDEMVQCVMCEDWFHERHLHTSLPEDYEAMTCSECMSKFPFLWAYVTSDETEVKIEKPRPAETCDDVDVTSVIAEDKTVKDGVEPTEHGAMTEHCNGEPAVSPTTEAKFDESSTNGTQQTSTSVKEGRHSQNDVCGMKRERNCDDSEGPSAKKGKLENIVPSVAPENDNDSDDTECRLKSLQKGDIKHEDHGIFWPDGWREKLCRCPDCLEMYQDRDIGFLIDESDTIQAYEEVGRNSDQNSLSDEESEAAVFASLNRVQQIEFARGVHDFKTELGKFLNSFAEEGKVVTEAAVREFFDGMKKKLGDDINMPQHNCR